MSSTAFVGEPRIVARIDLSALRHNLARVRACAPGARIMAAVKANAYGHGLLPVSRALVAEAVDALAVACLEEAMALREAGLRLPVVLLEGVLSAREAETAEAMDLDIVVHAPWQWSLLQSLAGRHRFRLWFKLNSGMNRLGFAVEDAASLYADLQAHPDWRFCGWLTHLACADEPAEPMTAAQVADFDAALEGLPGARSIANSAALIAAPDTRADWVRPGLMLYGASPIIGRSAAKLDLRPVMNLSARIIALHDLAPGQRVGYAASWIAERATRIAILACGYADGVPRCLPSGTVLSLHGGPVRVAGRVSMDMLAVELGAGRQAAIGDWVELWGDRVAVEEIAARTGTVAYELFCGLGQRVRFETSEQRR